MVFVQFVNVENIKGLQMLIESAHILRFKIEFPGVTFERHIACMDERLPCFQSLQNKAAGQRDICAEVSCNLHPQYIVIELFTFFHVLYCDQCTRVFHIFPP